MTEDKLPKIDTGQIKEETEGDGRDREREWNYKNNNHHITHTTNVSSQLLRRCCRRFCSLLFLMRLPTEVQCLPITPLNPLRALIGFQLKINSTTRTNLGRL